MGQVDLKKGSKIWFKTKMYFVNPNGLTVLKTNLFVRFLEESEDTKSHFEIIWPLAGNLSLSIALRSKQTDCWTIWWKFIRTVLYNLDSTTQASLAISRAWKFKKTSAPLCACDCCFSNFAMQFPFSQHDITFHYKVHSAVLFLSLGTTGKYSIASY